MKVTTSSRAKFTGAIFNFYATSTWHLVLQLALANFNLTFRPDEKEPKLEN